MRSCLTVLLGSFVVACGSHGTDGEHGGGHSASTEPPGSTPIAAVSGDAIYLVNGEDSSISVIDPASAKVVGTIALQNVSYPHHIYMSPDRSKLAVAVPGHDLSGGHAGAGQAGHAGGGAVLVLDATTGATVKSRRLDASNHNAAFSADGREIWTTQLLDEGTVLVLDATSLETKQTIRVGRVPAEVTFTNDGKYAFVANGTSDDLTIIDAASKTVVKTIPMDREPVGAWPGADGLMYVDCEVAKTIKVVDPKTLDVVRTYQLDFTPAIAAVPPSRTNELWVADTDAGKVVFYETASDTKIADIATAPGAHALAFTPDGATAFVTNQLGASVSVIDSQTRAVKTTIPVGRKPNGIVYRTR